VGSCGVVEAEAVFIDFCFLQYASRAPVAEPVIEACIFLYLLQISSGTDIWAEIHPFHAHKYFPIFL
jgi:hypothetical protein